jgi:hypothetical protein
MNFLNNARIMQECTSEILIEFQIVSQEHARVCKEIPSL